MAVVNELVTKFTFKGSLKPLKDFQSGLKDSIIGLAKYGAGAIAAASATALWANSVLRGSESLVRLSQDTDLSIKKLQQYQFIAAQNGVTTDSFTQSIKTLSEKIGEAATTGSDDFNRLGISVRDANGNIRTTDDILKDITRSFRGLSQAQQISFAQKLGIDKNLITAFNKSDEELQRLTETAAKFGLVTEAQTRQLDKYFASIETLKFGFTAVSRQIALSFAPALQSLSENVVNFLAEFNTTFGVVFKEFFDGIGNLLSAFNKLVQATVGWKAVFLALGAAIAIAFPFVAIVAGVTLVLTAIEDLITAFKGGKSVIADFFDNVFNIDIVERIQSLVASLKSLGSFFGGKISSFFGFGGVPMQPIGASNDNRTTTQTININAPIEVKANDAESAGRAVSSSLRTELENASFQFGKGGR